MTKIPKELENRRWWHYSEVYVRSIEGPDFTPYIIRLECLPDKAEYTTDWYSIYIYRIREDNQHILEFYDDAVSWLDALDKFNTWYKRMKEDTK